MQLVSSIQQGNCVLSVTGALTFADHKEWRRLCQLALEDEAKMCVLDIQQLENIDSAGLGMILALRTWVEREGMELRLRYDPDNFVGSMMKLVKFDAMLMVDGA
ncbi:MAG: STAS domain-containing protein [Kordiimonas sp.]